MVIYGYNKGFSSDARLILAFASSAVLVVVEVLFEKKTLSSKINFELLEPIFSTPQTNFEQVHTQNQTSFKKRMKFSTSEALSFINILEVRSSVMGKNLMFKICWGCRKFRLAKFNIIIFFFV